MRIHRLEIQAFGPFAGREHIDFDALTEQGLFLLNGPTGAGKSSVLDAICYALYGAVPGVRQNARRLRSDHAPLGLAPEVVCEFSAGSRRLEVTRSPAWPRPSKRGSGTTMEQAKTMLRERIAGEWVTRSTRNDEAGAELQTLLGMNREQFTRVVMLPQGEFAAFLRSEAAARGELLQRLFATDRFATVEQLLADHASRTGSRLQEAEAELDALLTRALDEVLRHGLPTGDCEDPASSSGAAGSSEDFAALEPAAPAGDSAPDFEVLQDRLAIAVSEGRQWVKETTALRDSLRRKRLGLETERRDRLAYRELAAEAERNRADLAEAESLRVLLENHRRAEILEAPLLARDDAARNARERREQLQSAVTALGDDPAAGTEAPDVPGTAEGGALPDFELIHDRIRENLARARATLPLEQDLSNLISTIEGTQRRLQQHTAESEQCAIRMGGHEQELAAVVDSLAAAETVALRVPQLTAESAEIGDRLELLREAEAAEGSLRELEEQQQDHQAQFLRAKEDWLGKLQLRLEQAAAELAAKLHEDAPCPVCGSEVHPRPATADALALVSVEDEERARQKQDLAESRLRESTAARNAEALRAASLRARSGDAEPAQLHTALGSLRGELAEAEKAARTAVELGKRKEALQDSLGALQARHTDLLRSRAEESSRLATLEESRTALDLRIRTERKQYASVAHKVRALEGLDERLARVCAALARNNQAAENLEQAELNLQSRLAASDFESAGAVRQALLPASQVDDAQRRIREAENTAHRIERDLQKPESTAAAALEAEGAPVPGAEDVAAAGHDEDDAAARLERYVLEVGLLEQSVVQLASYADRAAALAERLQPLQREHQLAKSVADTARGNGENLLRMSLSTYVLAARLEQVADAATERLQHMSDGRYSLVHSDSKSGNKKSGLGLNVIDSWTGMQRDTATLSGGESFMASLALALGLADVVQQESGGLDIETLFVDEGFGSLDDQSLEQVMNALENLRDGGRVVGLVSHVPELKQRIPAQLHVGKGRSGSTVRFVNQLERV